MRVESEEYERVPLRAHSLLADVPLHDVWVVDLIGFAIIHGVTTTRHTDPPA